MTLRLWPWMSSRPRLAWCSAKRAKALRQREMRQARCTRVAAMWTKTPGPENGRLLLSGGSQILLVLTCSGEFIYLKGPKRPYNGKDATNHGSWNPLVLGLGTRLRDPIVS